MKHLLVFISLILIYNFSFSQEFKAGILGGFVASQVDGDFWAGYNKPGVELGGFVSRKFSDRFSGLMEIKLIQKGSRKVPNYDRGDYTYYKLSLNYIEVPVIFQYHFKKRFIAEAGTGMAYLFLSLEDKDAVGWDSPYPAFNKFELPYFLGIHYKLSDKLTANFRYSYSVTPIRNHPGNQTYYFNKGQYNNLISAVLYYRFKE